MVLKPTASATGFYDDDSYFGLFPADSLGTMSSAVPQSKGLEDQHMLAFLWSFRLWTPKQQTIVNN